MKHIHYLFIILTLYSFTYSQNYGIFSDMNKFKNEKKLYKFEHGLIQRSAMIQIQLKNRIQNHAT